MLSISVIVPVYNGSLSIETLFHQLNKVLNSLPSQYEIILVDDYSQDNSWEIIKDLHNKHDHIKAFRLNKNYGQQSALLCGMEAASYDYVVTIDDDLQHKPDYIGVLVKEIQKGYDLVYCVFNQSYHSFYRKLGSKLTNQLFNFVLKKSKDIKISSFRIIRKSIVQEIIKQQKGYVYISASALRLTKKVKSINVAHQARKYGESNYNFKKLLKIFLKIYIYYSSNPLCRFFRKNEPIYEVVERLEVRG